MSRDEEQRKEIKGLSFDEMDDELQRPTGIWQEDVTREALRRLLADSQNTRKVAE